MKKLLFLLLFIPLVSFGQDYGNTIDAMKLCSIIQTNNFGTDAEAERGLDRILSVIGASKRFVLQPCNNINNAVAATAKGIRYIYYDRNFMSSVNSGNNWDNLFILAHEVGHHINGHSLDLVLYATEVVEPETLANKRLQELEADEFAGFILGKLGATLEQMSSAINLISSDKDDTYSTHPSKSKRLNAVKKGYNKAKGDSNNAVSDLYDVETAEEYYYKGIGNEQKGNKALALISYSKAIDINPNDEYYYIARANIKDQYKDFLGVIQDYSDAIRINPKADYYFLRALANSNYNEETKALKDSQGRVIVGTPDAIMDLSKAIEVNPYYEQAYLIRGYFKYLSKDYNEAIMDLSIAIELNPQGLYAYEYRALSYRDYETNLYNGKPISEWTLTDAIKDYSKLIELEPSNSIWYFNRAYCHTLSRVDEEKNKRKALKDLDKAIELDPNNGKLYEYRGNVKRDLVSFDTNWNQLTREEDKDEIASILKNSGACEDFREAIRLGWKVDQKINGWIKYYCD